MMKLEDYNEEYLAELGEKIGDPNFFATFHRLINEGKLMILVDNGKDADDPYHKVTGVSESRGFKKDFKLIVWGNPAEIWGED
jgi:hypothetical protein